MKTDSPESLAGAAAALMITVAIGTAAGHVLTVERVYEPSLNRDAGEESSPYPRWPQKRPLPTPLLRSNDRSRWCTIRALVDDGTYVIGRRDPTQASPANPYGDSGIAFEDGWTTVDKVLRPDTLEFYSSKPPFLPTLIAGEYWLLKHAFGWSLGGASPGRWWVVRIILLSFNVLPLAVYLILIDRLLVWLGGGDWGRLFVMATACFGTFVTSFANALNNHTVAACSVVFALAPALQVLFGGPEKDRAWRYAWSGFFAAFAACSELPATAFAVTLLAMLLLHAPRKTLLCFVPAAALPVAAFFLCNYLALGQLRPAYSELGGAWYQYPGSNFNPSAAPELRRGIDWAKDKELYSAYLFHFLLGHHGIFSLTPVWFLALAGVVIEIMARPGRAGAEGTSADPGSPLRFRRRTRTLAAMTLLVSVVVVAFYLVFTRNYGGWTVGPRWLIWLTPLWLLVLLPVADRINCCRAGRAVGIVLLGLSVLSTVLPAGSPWHHPWIYSAVEQTVGPLY